MNISVKERVVAVNDANFFGDPLVGIFNLGGLLEVKISAIREVFMDDSLRQPHPPEQPKPFLGKSVKDCYHGGCGEHGDEENRLSDESGLVAVGDRRKEVAADIAVEDVQAIHRQREGDE